MVAIIVFAFGNYFFVINNNLVYEQINEYDSCVEENNGKNTA
jgi:hypothetical protein